MKAALSASRARAQVAAACEAVAAKLDCAVIAIAMTAVFDPSA